MDFTAHEPERRRRSTTLLAPGCCCCCCCCVHSVGGLAGAIWGSLRRRAPLPETLTTEEQIRGENEAARAHKYAVKVYWLALTVVALLTIVVCTIAEPHEPIVGPAIILGFLPAGQLPASLISLIVIHVKNPPNKDQVLRRLGRITLWALLGAIIGSIGTVLTFAMM
jgi:streptolysin S family bacteriocin protoxin